VRSSDRASRILLREWRAGEAASTELFVEFQAAVEREENIFPGEELLAPIEGGVLVSEILEEFIDAGALGQAPTGAQRAGSPWE